MVKRQKYKSLSMNEKNAKMKKMKTYRVCLEIQPIPKKEKTLNYS